IHGKLNFAQYKQAWDSVQASFQKNAVGRAVKIIKNLREQVKSGLPSVSEFTPAAASAGSQNAHSVIANAMSTNSLNQIFQRQLTEAEKSNTFLSQISDEIKKKAENTIAIGGLP